jgi:hypothetical protein
MMHVSDGVVAACQSTDLDGSHVKASCAPAMHSWTRRDPPMYGVVACSNIVVLAVTGYATAQAVSSASAGSTTFWVASQREASTIPGAELCSIAVRAAAAHLRT